MIIENKCKCVDCKKHKLNGHNITTEETKFMSNEQVRELIVKRNS